MAILNSIKSCASSCLSRVYGSKPESSAQPIDPLSLTFYDKIQGALNFAKWGMIGAAAYGIAPQFTVPISYLAGLTGLGSEILSYCSLPKDAHWSEQLLSLAPFAKYIINYDPWVTRLFQATSLFNLSQASITRLSAVRDAFTSNPLRAIQTGFVHLFNLASSVTFAADSLGVINLQQNGTAQDLQKCAKQSNPFQCDLQRQCQRPVDLYHIVPPQCPGKVIIQDPFPIANAPCSPKAIANLPCEGCGMFSVQLYLTGMLGRLYQEGRYSGMKIDFDGQGLGHAEGYARNWFENYYCPVDIEIEQCSGAPHKTFSNYELSDHCHYAEQSWEYQRRNDLPRLPHKVARALIQKHFILRPEIQQEIDQFAQRHFPPNRHLITVHYRGTDKAGYTDAFEARRVSYEKMCQTILDYLQTLEPEDQRTAIIFVATDEEPFTQFAQVVIPNQIVISPSRKSPDSSPLHFGEIDRYQTGKEAIIDCHLLSKGDVLIRTSSNLSKMATILLRDGAQEILVTE
jgi:hypothetical protein